MRRLVATLVLSVLASAACLRKTEYQCAGDTSCGSSGLCEATGFCSFPDGNCSSGRRYNDAAGTYSGACTDGDMPMIDAAMSTSDTLVTDSSMSTDGAQAQCPSGYVTLPGGQSGHLYKVVTAADDWAAQHAACVLTTQKAYLAIPDDLTELQAMDTAIGASATYWVGIEDKMTDMQWRTVLATTQTFLPWLAPAPDDQNPGEDCVEAIAATHQFNDDRCNTSLPAICECGP